MQPGAAITNLQSGFGILSTTDVTLKSDNCTGITATGNITANGNLVSANSIYQGFNSFSSRPKDGNSGLLMFGDADGSLKCDVNLNVIGTASCNTAPSAASHLTRKDYVDALTYLTSSTGLTKTGATWSVNSSQSQITSVGTLTTLAIPEDLTGSTAAFSGTVSVASPTMAGHATTKAYVDSTLGLKTDKTYTDALSYLTAGRG